MARPFEGIDVGSPEREEDLQRQWRGREDIFARRIKQLVKDFEADDHDDDAMVHS
jgi:hypothetical protein